MEGASGRDQAVGGLAEPLVYGECVDSEASSCGSGYPAAEAATVERARGRNKGSRDIATDGRGQR